MVIDSVSDGALGDCRQEVKEEVKMEEEVEGSPELLLSAREEGDRESSSEDQVCCYLCSCCLSSHKVACIFQLVCYSPTVWSH